MDDFKTILQNLEQEEDKNFVDAMVGIFNKRIPQNIEELKIAQDKKDVQTLKRVGHLLIGSLSCMQFTYGANLAKQLESYCNEQNNIKAIEFSTHLINYLNQALTIINN